MYTVERVIKSIQGKDKEVKMLFGTGRLSNNPPAIIEVGQNNKKVMRGNKEHNFAIAFPDPSLGKDEHNRTKSKFYNIELWGKNAELLERFGFKGQPLEVAGRIETTTYQGKEYETLVIEKFEVKKYKPKDGESSADGGQDASENRSSNVETGNSGSQVSQTDPFKEDGRPIDISDDDIPF
jgi:single-strand DNA-binding protein